MQLTPDDHPDKLSRLDNLGDSYHSRFERLGELFDIDKAISCHTQAARLAPDAHSDKPRWLSNLGNSYGCRFRQVSELSDIDKAITCHTEAVHLTPDDHSAKPDRLSNLGTSHYRRFKRLGELSDIDQAISCHIQAIQLTPDGHARLPDMFSSLGRSYDRRFERLEGPSDIDKAISFQAQAVQLTPEGHSNKPAFLYGLGCSHLRRFDHLGALSDGKAASEFFQQAAQLPISKPILQFHSAHKWAKCLSFLSISPRLAYQTAMELLPRLIWLGATIEQRYIHLTDIGDVAMEAAAWAISVQAYDVAVEWLEEGRSIVWNQILQLRTPFDNLASVDPMLAQRLQLTARELEHAGLRSPALHCSISDASDLDRGTQHHHQLATEWDLLLGQARSLPGFDTFMRPRKASELMRVAKEGPVVLINVHLSRCDALIILPHSARIAHVPLEKFSAEKADYARAQLVSVLGRRGDRARGFQRTKPAPTPEHTFRSMLAALWSDVVEPVLSFLGYKHKAPVNELPTLTWCTTGALSFLPLHAAGCYDGLQPNAFDLVVTSYTPTISALLTLTPSISNHFSGLLAIGLEHTQGLGELPNTVRELSLIKEYAQANRFLRLDGPNATVDAVLQGMEEYSWVHLACHASQNPVNPAQSAFHLHNGNLTLETITRRSLKNKGLAFLSACQTAAGDDKRPDESIHLAAGMLFNGYPSVVATMWSIWDEDAPEFAGQVYAELLRNGKMDCTRAARALHKAVASLREKVGENWFERWVPFIHIGV